MIASAQRAWWPYVDLGDVRAKPTISAVAAREPPLFAAHDQIDRVQALSDPSAVANARVFLQEFYALVASNKSEDKASVISEWRNPHISASDDGDIAFEWWQGKRKLTIYIGPDE